MDIHDLKIFLMIAQEGSVSKLCTAFTFPFVISAIASKQTMACAANMGHPMPFLQYVVLIETIIAAALVVYTYVRFMGAIFGGKK